jgi:predicted YcjX-like family ATPase
MVVLLAIVQRLPAQAETAVTRTPPQVSALEIAEILTSGGFIVENAQPVLNPVEGWRAQQAIEFTVIHEQMPSQMIVLSYESADAAGLDAFMTQLREAYAEWPLVQMGNLLVLCSSETPDAACQAVIERLNSVIIAPFYGLDAEASR